MLAVSFFLLLLFSSSPLLGISFITFADDGELHLSLTSDRLVTVHALYELLMWWVRHAYGILSCAYVKFLDTHTRFVNCALYFFLWDW